METHSNIHPSRETHICINMNIYKQNAFFICYETVQKAAHWLTCNKPPAVSRASQTRLHWIQWWSSAGLIDIRSSSGAEVIRLTCHWFHSLLQRRKTLTSTQHKHARASATPQRSLGASALLSEKCRFWLSRQWEALRESHLTEREEAWKWTLEREKDVFTHKQPPVVTCCLFNAICNSQLLSYFKDPLQVLFFISKLQLLAEAVNIPVRCRSLAQRSISWAKFIWFFHLHNSFWQLIAPLFTYLFIMLL